VVADLQPYLFDPEYGLSSSEQADFLPALWQQDLLPAQVVKGSSATQDKRLGLPWVRSGVMLLYNRSWAQELGYARPPQSSQDFQKQACAAAQVNQTDSDRTNDATGGWLVTGDSAELAGWIYAFGGEFTRSDGRGYQFDTPEAHQAAGFIHSLAQQGCAWHGDVVPVEAIATRQALFALVRLADLGDLQNGLDEASVDWTLLPFAPAQEGGLPAIVSYGPSLVMAQSTASRQLAAWLFIRWLTSPENQARWAQINHAFPTRSSALDHLQLAPVRDSAWQSWRQSLEYLPALHSEPYYASWSKVRWSLADGLTQLMLPDLPDSSDNGDRIPLVLQMLDDLAAEIHIQVR
jgi:multiple sugar transport system substrate-binding protein/sn-glycerol 3-phosphate transport system substrate-binding protein